MLSLKLIVLTLSGGTPQVLIRLSPVRVHSSAAYPSGNKGGGRFLDLTLLIASCASDNFNLLPECYYEPWIDVLDDSNESFDQVPCEINPFI